MRRKRKGYLLLWAFVTVAVTILVWNRHDAWSLASDAVKGYLQFRIDHSIID